MSSHRDWDERRSPQWKYLLQKKDPKYYRKRQKEAQVQKERAKKRDLENLMDCSPKESGTDLEQAYTNVINTELSARLAGLNKSKKEGK